MIAVTRKHCDANLRSGAVLLVVLFVSMVVALMSMTVLVRANRQMLGAESGAIRLKLDYLAESGLVHAKTLLLHPQDADMGANGHWSADALQIEGGDARYNLQIIRPDNDDGCTYRIISTAYRGDLRSCVEAALRLDPCIALWLNAGGHLPAGSTITGDVYCAGVLTSSGMINGDVFADSFSGTCQGQVGSPGQQGVQHPAVTCNLFFPQYLHDGSSYAPALSPDELPNPGANPAGVLYYDGDLDIDPNTPVSGILTLVVTGNLTIRDGAIVEIRPAKNYPALVVAGELKIQSGAQLDARGLVQVGSMRVAQDAGRIVVTGALYAGSISIDTLDGGGPMLIRADPMSAAIKLNDSWSPASGGFFKYVKRAQEPTGP